MSTNDNWDDAVEANAQSNETWDSTSSTPIVGKYIGMKTNVGPNASNIYNIVNEEDGEIWGVWGSAVIDSKFEEIPVNSRVRIEYLGKKPGKRGEFKDYSIKYKAPAQGEAAPAAQPAAPTVPLPEGLGEGEGQPIELAETPFDAPKANEV